MKTCSLITLLIVTAALVSCDKSGQQVRLGGDITLCFYEVPHKIKLGNPGDAEVEVYSLEHGGSRIYSDRSNGTNYHVVVPTTHAGRGWPAGYQSPIAPKIGEATLVRVDVSQVGFSADSVEHASVLGLLMVGPIPDATEAREKFVAR
jgi:hypothetical protein